jgi:hypothetical protein
MPNFLRKLQSVRFFVIEILGQKFIMSTDLDAALNSDYLKNKSYLKLTFLD